jgi:hypothetical protein
MAAITLSASSTLSSTTGGSEEGCAQAGRGTRARASTISPAHIPFSTYALTVRLALLVGSALEFRKVLSLSAFIFFCISSIHPEQNGRQGR